MDVRDRELIFQTFFIVFLVVLIKMTRNCVTANVIELIVRTRWQRSWKELRRTIESRRIAGRGQWNGQPLNS